MSGARRLGVRMRPTLFGVRALVFYAVVMLAYFASPYTNLMFMMFGFLSVLFALNFVWTWGNIRGVQGRLDEIPPFAAGQIVESRFESWSTRSKSAHERLDFTLRIGHRKTDLVAKIAHLDGRTQARATLPRLPRGIHEVVAFEAASSYPLGFLRIARRLDGPRRLVVYPEPSPAPPGDSARTVVSNREDAASLEALALNSASRLETAGLRGYRVGDSIRDVHWRASARQPRDLVVREYESHTERSIEVVLDARCADPEVFERALSAVTRLALNAQELDQALFFHTQGHSGNYGAGHEPMRSLLEWLAIASPLSTRAAPPPHPAGRDAIELPAALSSLDGLRSDQESPA